jgi:hypothetical protein
MSRNSTTDSTGLGRPKRRNEASKCRREKPGIKRRHTINVFASLTSVQGASEYCLGVRLREVYHFIEIHRMMTCDK